MAKWAIAETKEAEKLTWIVDPNANNLCGGYYFEPGIGFADEFNQFVLPGQTVITTTDGFFSATDTTTLQQGVIIDQFDRRIETDKLVLERDSETGKIKIANLTGDVKYLSPGHLLVGDSAQIYLNESKGTTDDAVYRFALFPVELNANDKKLYRLNAWGRARQIEQLGEGQYLIKDGTFSTCPPGQGVWNIKAKTFRIDEEKSIAVARNATIYIKGVPVGYTPYMSFPLDKERKSGFLRGTYTLSDHSGLAASVPYYWNIAPNYDLTITPWLLTKRGVYLDNYFRYLTPKSSGSFQIGVLPGDKAFADFKKTAPSRYSNQTLLDRLQSFGDNRWFVSWKNNVQIAPNWRANIDYNRVSDDYFIQDFRNVYSFYNENRLLQKIDVNYDSRYWNFLARVQTYQTMQLVNRPLPTVYYDRVPQLQLTGNYPRGPGGLSYHWNQELVYFVKPVNIGTGKEDPTGLRLNIQPGVSLPMYSPAGYFVPRIQFQLTHYQIHNQLPNRPSTINRALPIVDVNAGLVFVRNKTFFNKQYEQTLEPQLYYVYIPYVNQSDIPLFNTQLQSFSFDQLFRANRFTGIDRMGDTHQLTTAVTTKLLDRYTGEEKLSASLGIINYFKNRRVTLCNTPGCPDTNAIGEISKTTTYSPVVGRLNYQLHRWWSVNTEAAVDPNTGKVDQGNLDLRFRPGDEKLINLGYNFIRNGDQNPKPGQTGDRDIINLSQANVTFVWPLRDKWQAFGRWNYNISQKNVRNLYAGVEYNSCCWGVRFMGARTLRSYTEKGSPEFDHMVYLQFELKGLGFAGTRNIGQQLLRDIPGYRDRFGDI